MVGVAGLGGQQHEQRPEPLAAGLHQVAGRLGDEPGLALDVLEQCRFDLVHPGAQTRFELLVEDGQGQRAGHLMNTPTRPSRSMSAPGTRPSSSVAATPTAMTVPVSTLGVVTLGPSPIGSAKNISTITRT